MSQLVESVQPTSGGDMCLTDLCGFVFVGFHINVTILRLERFDLIFVAQENATEAQVDAFFCYCWPHASYGRQEGSLFTFQGNKYTSPWWSRSKYPQILQIEILRVPGKSVANDMMMDGAMPPRAVKVLYEKNFSTTSFILQL